MPTSATPHAPQHPFDAHLAEVLPRAAALEPWTPADGPMPTLYLGHGAPPLMEDPLWMSQLFSWTESMPKPRAVLIVSAHWEEAPTTLTSPLAGTDLVHDFWGFDQRYFEMRYDTPDASVLAAQVAALLPDREPVVLPSAHSTTPRGLDHGAWVPLKVMYPLADVPVLQLSMPTHDPARLLDLGRRLRPLREQGVLVVGSGFMTHGLPHLTRAHMTGQAQRPTWSADFDAWAADALAAGDVDTLSDYARAPGMPYAHPTVEHYTPMFVTLGAGGDHPVRTRIEGFGMGLSKRSFQID